MVSKAEVLLMVKVAQMYYVNDMEQDRIAEELKVTPPAIWGILKDAVEYGIVEVKIGSCIKEKAGYTYTFKHDTKRNAVAI